MRPSILGVSAKLVSFVSPKETPFRYTLKSADSCESHDHARLTSPSSRVAVRLGHGNAGNAWTTVVDSSTAPDSSVTTKVIDTLPESGMRNETSFPEVDDCPPDEEDQDH